VAAVCRTDSPLPSAVTADDAEVESAAAVAAMALLHQWAERRVQRNALAGCAAGERNSACGRGTGRTTAAVPHGHARAGARRARRDDACCVRVASEGSCWEWPSATGAAVDAARVAVDTIAAAVAIAAAAIASACAVAVAVGTRTMVVAASAPVSALAVLLPAVVCASLVSVDSAVVVLACIPLPPAVPAACCSFHRRRLHPRMDSPAPVVPVHTCHTYDLGES